MSSPPTDASISLALDLIFCLNSTPQVSEHVCTFVIDVTKLDGVFLMALHRLRGHLVVVQGTFGLCAAGVRARRIDGDGDSVLRTSNNLGKTDVVSLVGSACKTGGLEARLTWL